MLEFWGCSGRPLRDGAEMAQLFRRVNRKLGTNTVHSAWRRLETGGVVGFSTSYDGHFAIRAWPKDGHVMVDGYSCRDVVDVKKVIPLLEKGFASTAYQITEVERGLGADQPPLLVLTGQAESGMLPSEVMNDGGRDDISGHPTTLEGVVGYKHEPQLRGENGPEEPDRRPSA